MKINLSNKVYDVLKFLTLYLLPGLAGLYFGLSGIWGLPYSNEVVGTIMAVATFLGAILGLGVIQYNKIISQLEKTRVFQPTIENFIMPAEEAPYAIILSGKMYDLLYWVAQIVLPALGTLYFAISSIWHLPYAEQVVGTIALIDAFLGIFLGINTAQYKKYKPEENS